MNRSALNGIQAALLMLFAAPGLAQVSPQSIDGPNGYGFVSDTYYAEATDTNASISVQWTSGNRDYCCGNVGFATSSGSALPEQDYEDVWGTLSFSGPFSKSFNVPLHAAPAPEDKTVQLTLKQIDPNSYFWPRSTAVLVIRAAPPKLDFINTSNSLRLSWPAAYTNYVVETIALSAMESGEWNGISATPCKTNGQFSVDVPVDGQTRFFRLRKQ